MEKEEEGGGGGETLIPFEKMYPKTKVRVQEKPVTLHEEDTVIRAIESLSLEGRSSSRRKKINHGAEQRIYSPPSCSRISCSNSGSSLALKSPTKGKEAKGSNNESGRRAASVPRPRAVLSSSYNDGMIGNQNRRINESTTSMIRSKQAFRSGTSSGELRISAARATNLTIKATGESEKKIVVENQDPIVAARPRSATVARIHGEQRKPSRTQPRSSNIARSSPSW